ncbi:uncharacterized protein PgNI_07633, partial [Pyricularia grisea]|uniref:Uncharacterized protein n=1 Tax=Pyricularia grisea TaxID=148305 RepID=A0A6P8B1Q4_PYRGI
MARSRLAPIRSRQRHPRKEAALQRPAFVPARQCACFNLRSRPRLEIIAQQPAYNYLSKVFKKHSIP